MRHSATKVSTSSILGILLNLRPCFSHQSHCAGWPRWSKRWTSYGVSLPSSSGTELTKTLAAELNIDVSIATHKRTHPTQGDPNLTSNRCFSVNLAQKGAASSKDGRLGGSLFVRKKLGPRSLGNRMSLSGNKMLSSSVLRL